jgi:molybdopterin converting factor small subunit
VQEVKKRKRKGDLLASLLTAYSHEENQINKDHSQRPQRELYVVNIQSTSPDPKKVKKNRKIVMFSFFL